MGVLQFFYDMYVDLMENRSDERTQDWFLMGSPWPTVLLTALYFHIVQVLGPKLMEDRKPFQLRHTMIFYNAFQAAFSFWMFIEIANSGWFTHYSLRCQPVDYSDHPDAMRALRAYWWFYFSKLVDFLDTIFFILRKKNEQVSRLHLIHHTIMPTACWFGVKFIAGGHSTLLCLLNTFVHTVMYSYYLLAALGKEYQKYLWWKKYLTIMQMVQFVIVLVHACQLFFIDCDFPIIFAWWCLFAATLFFIMFANYFFHSYLRPGKIRVSVKKDAKQWITAQWPVQAGR